MTLEKEATDFSKKIEELLQSSTESQKLLGTTTINPIYEKFEIVEDVRKIDVTIGYPNSREEYEPKTENPLEIITKKLQNNTRLISTSGKNKENLKAGAITKLFRPLTEKGYIEKFLVAKKALATKIAKTTNIQELLKQDKGTHGEDR